MMLSIFPWFILPSVYYFLVKHLFRLFLFSLFLLFVCFFKSSCVSFTYGVEWVIYICWLQVLCHLYTYDIFSQCVIFLFIFITISLEEQRSLILVRLYLKILYSLSFWYPIVIHFSLTQGHNDFHIYCLLELGFSPYI